jgi:hypothetical protein
VGLASCILHPASGWVGCGKPCRISTWGSCSAGAERASRA